MVEAGDDINIAQEVITGIAIVNNAYQAYKNTKSDYYYFPAGKNTGKAIGLLFTSLDKWASLGIITPTDPWTYYAE